MRLETKYLLYECDVAVTAYQRIIHYQPCRAMIYVTEADLSRSYFYLGAFSEVPLWICKQVVLKWTNQTVRLNGNP